MAVVTMQLKDASDLLRKLTPQLAAQPSRNFLNRAVIVVQTHARQRAWVDRGTWRNSIVTEVDPSPLPRWGRVGSNLGQDGVVAASIELGSAPHWAPLAPLEAYAQRHGMGPGAGRAIQRKIARVGTKPNHALTGGLDDAAGEIQGLVPIMAAEIESLRGL